MIHKLLETDLKNQNRLEDSMDNENVVNPGDFLESQIKPAEDGSSSSDLDSNLSPKKRKIMGKIFGKTKVRLFASDLSLKFKTYFLG